MYTARRRRRAEEPDRQLGFNLIVDPMKLKRREPVLQPCDPIVGILQLVLSVFKTQMEKQPWQDDCLRDSGAPSLIPNRPPWQRSDQKTRGELAGF